MNRSKRVENGLYIAGWCLLAIAAVAALTEKITGLDILSCLPQCAFHTLTGLSCPGCGGTRAVRALLQGKLLQSFCYHPIVPYAAALGIWFMLSQTIERLSRGRWRIGLRFRESYLWIALGILVLNVLLKNIFSLFA